MHRRQRIQTYFWKLCKVLQLRDWLYIKGNFSKISTSRSCILRCWNNTNRNLLKKTWKQYFLTLRKYTSSTYFGWREKVTRKARSSKELTNWFALRACQQSYSTKWSARSHSRRWKMRLNVRETFRGWTCRATQESSIWTPIRTVCTSRVPITLVSRSSSPRNKKERSMLSTGPNGKLFSQRSGTNTAMW